MPESDLDLLTRAAADAGKVAMRFFRASPQVWDKGDDQGPVTEADLAVNDLLVRTLRGARPDYGWLSEETPDDSERLTKRDVFVIDPIDGTRAFIAGEDSFAISLAVVRDGVPIAAAVALPARDLIFAATEDGPATLNGAEIAVSAQSALADADILATRAHLLPHHWRGEVPHFKRSFRNSLAYRMCLVAQGRFDGMLTLRDTWEWDIAAGALIAARAGAVVTDRHGGGLKFNSPQAKTLGVIACGPLLHPHIMVRLGD